MKKILLILSTVVILFTSCSKDFLERDAFGSLTVDEFFKNEKLDIEELRVFTACKPKDEKPKANSVVVINYNNKILVGKYTWMRQQNMDNTKQFYLVSVKGFSSTQNIEIDEEDWSKFYPLAVEVNQ